MTRYDEHLLRPGQRIRTIKPYRTLNKGLLGTILRELEDNKYLVYIPAYGEYIIPRNCLEKRK